MSLLKVESLMSDSLPGLRLFCVFHVEKAGVKRTQRTFSARGNILAADIMFVFLGHEWKRSEGLTLIFLFSIFL